MSSGGNSGSQASTLVIQAMAVGDITFIDWWRVMRREILSGIMFRWHIGIYWFYAHIYLACFNDAWYN